ncbi:MAG TPA: hypothetical protein VEI97_19155, partial [bacterium]|nr:hypothetical protein [bacterium]
TLGIAAPAQAAPLDFLKNITTSQLPTVPAWKVGQEATHRLTVDMGAGGTVSGDLRLAVTGQEGDHYWLELNLSNPKGSIEGNDIASFFSALHIRLLTKMVDQASLQKAANTAATNPANALDDTLRKIQFQLPGQPLYEMDLSTLKSTVGPMVGGAVPTTPEGTPKVPDLKGDVQFKFGQETVTVPGGTFNNSLFWDVAYTEGGNSGSAHVNMADTIPLLPIAKVLVNASGKDVGGNLQVKLELISSAQTGAKTRTVGTPKAFDMNEFISGIMGGATLE